MLRSPFAVEPTFRRPSVILEIVGWLLVAGMGILALTQAIGWTGWPIVYAVQAGTPYLLTPSVPLAMVAASQARHAMAFVSALIAVALLWLTMPVVFHAEAARPAADGVHLTIAHANTYIDNDRPDAAATVLIDLDADLIAVTELSKGISDALRAQGVAESHPYFIEKARGSRNGVALFSRYPISGAAEKFGHQVGIDAIVDVHGTPVRVMVVHPLPAVSRWALRYWRRDLSIIGSQAVEGDTPTVVVGDFNASRWHPVFRRLLARGLTDAHEQLGHGFSTSWPTDWVTRFVRLDHALMTEGLVATDIDDLTVPGSDHRAFVVTIATT